MNTHSIFKLVTFVHLVTKIEFGFDGTMGRRMGAEPRGAYRDFRLGAHSPVARSGPPHSVGSSTIFFVTRRGPTNGSGRRNFLGLLEQGHLQTIGL